jgi:hypothetical protein
MCITKTILFGIVVSMVFYQPSGLANVISTAVNPSNGHTYHLLDNTTWTASEAEAVDLGGHLVTINDAPENAWVYDTFTDSEENQRGLWIGLYEPTEGAWAWISGDTTSYNKWALGEPSGGTGNNYAHILWPGDLANRASQWNDIADIDNWEGIKIYGVVEVGDSPISTPDAGCTFLLFTFSFSLIRMIRRHFLS